MFIFISRIKVDSGKKCVQNEFILETENRHKHNLNSQFSAMFSYRIYISNINEVIAEASNWCLYYSIPLQVPPCGYSRVETHELLRPQRVSVDPVNKGYYHLQFSSVQLWLKFLTLTSVTYIYFIAYSLYSKLCKTVSKDVKIPCSWQA